jgi:hypothetical protein
VPDRPLELILPTSWFADHDDPLNDHPLFQRYIPEIRLRAAWEVPGINVRVDEELEPDGYRILVLDQVEEEGRVSREHRYGSAAALKLLGLPPADGEAAEVHGLVRVGRPAAGDARGLDALLTMPGLEVVAWRLSEIAGANAERLGRRLPPSAWPKRIGAVLSRALGPRS